MRRITRAEEPRELSLLRAYEPDRRWNTDGAVAADAYKAIKSRLRSVQNGCCAYCERPLVDGRECVEHVHPKSLLAPCAIRPSSNPHYEWNNLLLACKGYGTCDDAKHDKHLCGEVLFPDELDDDPVFLVDRLTGSLLVNPAVAADTQIKAQRSIEELLLNDASLRESRLAVILEFDRRFHDEHEDPPWICLDMRQEGFPTTIEAMTLAFS